LGGATAGLAGLALVGCGDDNNDVVGSTPASEGTAPGAQASATIKRGGELVLSVGAAGAQPMDPHISLNKAFFYWGSDKRPFA
jgi:hypothetical protein